MLHVALAFPGGLAELSLEDPSATDAHGGQCCVQEQQGPAFLPLQALRLGKLSVTLCFQARFPHNAVVSQEALWSLGQLTTLHTLHLSLYTVQPPDLHFLGGLVNLHTCHLHFLDARLTLVDVAALFAATGLTSLHLTDVGQDGSAQHPPGAVAACLSPLGALTALRSLRLASYCVLTDHAFAAVALLGQLTQLCCCGVRLTSAAPPAPLMRGARGVLPLLQRLRTCGYNDEPQRPNHLLGMLQPFLPLPSLTSLNNKTLQLLISHSPGAAAAAQAADLQALVRALADAPHLRLRYGLTLAGAPDEPLLTLTDVAPVLQPLSHLSDSVTLVRLAPVSEPLWGPLLGTLVGLQDVRLQECPGLTAAHLTSLVRHLSKLRCLRLLRCDGVDCDALVGLAGACATPLELYVRPLVEAGVVVRCTEVQARVFDAQHITWLRWEGGEDESESDTGSGGQ